MNFQEIKRQYKQSLKSMDTEEHIDLFFYRPLGYAWALLCARLGITPNTITIASIFLGVAGGVLLYFGAQPLVWLNYVGIFLIVWANTFDSADGKMRIIDFNDWPSFAPCRAEAAPHIAKRVLAMVKEWEQKRK